MHGTVLSKWQSEEAAPASVSVLLSASVLGAPSSSGSASGVGSPSPSSAEGASIFCDWSTGVPYLLTSALWLFCSAQPLPDVRRQCYIGYRGMLNYVPIQAHTDQVARLQVSRCPGAVHGMPDTPEGGTLHSLSTKRCGIELHTHNSQRCKARATHW